MHMMSPAEMEPMYCDATMCAAILVFCCMVTGALVHVLCSRWFGDGQASEGTTAVDLEGGGLSIEAEASHEAAKPTKKKPRSGKKTTATTKKVHPGVRKVTKTGVPVTAETKCILENVYHNLGVLSRARKGLGKSQAEMFHNVTGMAFSTLHRWMKGRNNKKDRNDDGLSNDSDQGSDSEVEYDFVPPNMGPPKKKGPAAQDLASEEDLDFAGWLADKVEKAKSPKKNNVPGYTTLQSLREDLLSDKGVRASTKQIRRSLRALGYLYSKRKMVWTSRRAEPGVQTKVKEFLEFAIEHSEHIEGVGYRWKVPVAFFDETYIWKSVTKDWSWAKKGDLTKDAGKDGKGTRANVLHALFSHVDQSSHDHSKILRTWLESWSGKGHEFKGKCTAEVVATYVEKYIVPTLGKGGYLVLDNAGTHKKFLQRMEDWTDDEVYKFISETAIDQEKWSLYDASIPQYEGPAYRKALLKYVREEGLRDLELIEMLKKHDVTVVYTPPYHPEFQPIERFWSCLKYRFSTCNSSLQYTERIRAAIAAVPSNRADRYIQGALRRCYSKVVEGLSILDVEDPSEQQANDSDSD